MEHIELKTESKLNRLRNVIISHIPHELLTPLNSIIGNSDLLYTFSDTLSQDEIKNIAKSINDGGERLLNLIRHYLTYIQLTTVRPYEIEKALVLHCNKMAVEIISEIARNYEREEDVRFNLADTHCWAGEEELKLIITELADNAFKFSKPGTPVTISLRNHNDATEFIFHNTGRVFPPGAISQIGAFSQFERNKFEQQGSGLGLIMVKMITDLYQGSLDIKSSEEEGNCITVALPGM